MNFNLAGPDLVIIALIVLLLFGAKGARPTWDAFQRWKGERDEPGKDPLAPMEMVNRAILALTILLLVLACGMGFLGWDS